MGCTCEGTREKKRQAWIVEEYCSNHSAFNGYRFTPSDYSRIRCIRCGGVWRTKAAYVEDLLGKKVLRNTYDLDGNEYPEVSFGNGHILITEGDPRYCWDPDPNHPAHDFQYKYLFGPDQLPTKGAYWCDVMARMTDPKPV